VSEKHSANPVSQDIAALIEETKSPDSRRRAHAARELGKEGERRRLRSLLDSAPCRRDYLPRRVRLASSLCFGGTRNDWAAGGGSVD